MKAPATPAATLLTLQQAGVSYGSVQALLPLDLALRQGERLALVGANGSGKSTLLRLMHGLLPTTGQRTLHPLAPERRLPRLAMLFQRPFLLNLSAERNVRIGLWLAGVPRPERIRRGAEALARVGLADIARRPARALSGGQQQRLALARAWALKPDLLLLDEPTASLDPSAKQEVEALIEAFAAEGLTVVMSTHNLGQAKRLASRMAYLEAGRLVVDLPAEAFFNGPLPEPAQRFLRAEQTWR